MEYLSAAGRFLWGGVQAVDRRVYKVPGTNNERARNVSDFLTAARRVAAATLGFNNTGVEEKLAEIERTRVAARANNARVPVTPQIIFDAELLLANARRDLNNAKLQASETHKNINKTNKNLAHTTGSETEKAPIRIYGKRIEKRAEMAVLLAEKKVKAIELELLALKIIDRVQKIGETNDAGLQAEIAGHQDGILAPLDEEAPAEDPRLTSYQTALNELDSLEQLVREIVALQVDAEKILVEITSLNTKIQGKIDQQIVRGTNDFVATARVADQTVGASHFALEALEALEAATLSIAITDTYITPTVTMINELKDAMLNIPTPNRLLVKGYHNAIYGDQNAGQDLDKVAWVPPIDGLTISTRYEKSKRADVGWITILYNIGSSTLFSSFKYAAISTVLYSISYASKLAYQLNNFDDFDKPSPAFQAGMRKDKELSTLIQLAVDLPTGTFSLENASPFTWIFAANLLIVATYFIAKKGIGCISEQHAQFLDGLRISYNRANEKYGHQLSIFTASVIVANLVVDPLVMTGIIHGAPSDDPSDGSEYNVPDIETLKIIATVTPLLLPYVAKGVANIGSVVTSMLRAFRDCCYGTREGDVEEQRPLLHPLLHAAPSPSSLLCCKKS